MTDVLSGPLAWSVPPVDHGPAHLGLDLDGSEGSGEPKRPWLGRLAIAIAATLVILVLVGGLFVAVAAASSGPVASCGGG